jgi:hypothetical protein
MLGYKVVLLQNNEIYIFSSSPFTQTNFVKSMVVYRDVYLNSLNNVFLLFLLIHKIYSKCFEESKWSFIQR